MDPTELIALYKDLKGSFMEFYVKHTKENSQGAMDLKDTLDRINTIDLYIKSDFKTLWLMERASRQMALMKANLPTVEKVGEKENCISYFK